MTGSARDRAGASKSPAATVAHVLFTLILCLAMTALPLAAHFVSPLLAIACQFLLATGLVLYLTPMAPLVVVFAILFQNLFVSLLSGYLTGQDDYNFVRGYNFLTMMIVWLWLFGHYAINWRRFSSAANRVMLAGLIAFALIGFYLLLGMAKNPTGAIIYLRNIITPMVLFQIFFLTALRSHQPMVPFFVAVTLIVIGLGYIEMLDRRLWLDLTNGWRLWELGAEGAVKNLVLDKEAQETGRVVVHLLDTMKVAFLNTPLLGDHSFTILRMNGPNIHAISYSYALGFLAIMMLMNRRWYLALPMVPLMLLASAKGAMILLFLAFCALLARKLFGAMVAFAGLVLVLATYVVIGIVLGLKIGDYHVLGFMGGLYNFFGDPLGNGLGNGGNLVSNFQKLDWPAYQAAGRTPVAMESAVGVMLHQMGVAAFGLLAVYCWLAWQTYKVSFKSQIQLHSVASFALIIVLVNGIFQEEAIFSPLALGLIMGLNGHILGSVMRSGNMASLRDMSAGAR